MNLPNIEALGQEAIWMLIMSLFFVVVVMMGLLWLGWWVTQTRGSLSPYSKKPMMLGVDLAFSIKQQVEAFLTSLPQPENKPFDCTKAAICRETGRIFQDAVKRGEIIRLDWTFLQDRYPGNWVSWGSVDTTKQAIIKMCHRSLDPFQFEQSCPNTLPKDITPDFIFTKPGPLYVDVAKKTFLGWQKVPGTSFEVLVVKKPDFESIEELL
jgi:hypothetical protein